MDFKCPCCKNKMKQYKISYKCETCKENVCKCCIIYNDKNDNCYRFLFKNDKLNFKHPWEEAECLTCLRKRR